MKVSIEKFQVGGSAPAPEANAAPQGGAEEQLNQLAQKLIQELGPEACTALVTILTQMLQSANQPQQAPVAYQKLGGKLVKVTRK